MRFLLDDKLILSGQSLDAVKDMFNEYDFKETVPEYGDEIIFHGKVKLRSVDCETVIHMYFSKDTYELQSMIIHPFPINFDKVQSYLEKQFGKAASTIKNTMAEWIIENGKMIHKIEDRWGEEEVVYIDFCLKD